MKTVMMPAAHSYHCLGVARLVLIVGIVGAHVCYCLLPSTTQSHRSFQQYAKVFDTGE